MPALGTLAAGGKKGVGFYELSTGRRGCASCLVRDALYWGTGTCLAEG